MKYQRYAENPAFVELVLEGADSFLSAPVSFFNTNDMKTYVFMEKKDNSVLYRVADKTTIVNV